MEILQARITRLLLFVTILIIFIAETTQAHDSWAMAFELKDKEDTCFYQEWREVKPMSFSFRVVRGGNRDIDLKIESPSGTEIFNQTKQKQGEFQFETGWGTFSFCFSNAFSTVSHKVIYFELRPLDHDSLADEAGQKKPYVDTQMEHSIELIHFYNEQSKGFQRHYKTRETLGRHLADTIHFRVFWWSLSEAVIVIMVGFGQVLMLKNLFRMTTPATAKSVTPPTISLLLAN